MKGNCNSKSFKVMAVTGISSLLLAVSALVPTSICSSRRIQRISGAESWCGIFSYD